MSSTVQMRQVARTSCDMCRKLKVRCIRREDETCMRCFERGETCFTTSMPKREAKPKRRERLEEIEERIQRMETILTSSNLDTDTMTPQMDSTDPDLHDQMSSLFLGDQETSVFVGPSAGLSIFSPRGLDWLASKTGSSQLTNLIKIRLEELPSATKASMAWQNKMMGQQTPFPSKETMDVLINIYFERINAHIPIFSEHYFRPLYDQNPNPNPQENPSLYAAISIILTIACIELDLGPRPFVSEMTSNWSATGDNTRALGFLANCWSVFTQLCFSRGDILTVQALAGMGLSLEILLDPEASHIALGVAIRVAMSLGLHRKVELKAFSQVDIDQRRMIFWFLYSWDKSLSLRMGRSPYIHDVDIEIEVPNEEEFLQQDPRDDSLAFLYNIRLARIAYKIYIELYSGRSRKKSPQEHDRAIVQLDRELKGWCDGLPADKRPSPLFAQRTDLPSQMALFLHLEYYNCITMVHRARYYQGITVSSDSQLPKSVLDMRTSQLYDGHLRCLDAARRTARLFSTIVKSIQGPDKNIICHLAYYPLSSYLVIFVNLINNPRDSYVKADLTLMRSILFCVMAAICESGSPLANLMSGVFATLQSIADKYLTQVESEGWINKKRSFNEEDSDLPAGGATSWNQRKEEYSYAHSNDKPRKDISGLGHADMLRDVSGTQISDRNSSSSPGHTGSVNITPSEMPGDAVPLFMPFIPWTLDWGLDHIGYSNANFSQKEALNVNDETIWQNGMYDQFVPDSFGS